MTAPAFRPWCAVARFAGKAEFIGGTVAIEADAPATEVDRRLREHFETFLPQGFEIVRPVAGALFFQPERGEA